MPAVERDIDWACTDGLLRSRQRPQRFVLRVARSIRPGARRRLAHGRARTPPRRPAGFESAALMDSWRGRALARFGCGRRAGAAAFGIRHSFWRVGVATL